MNKDQNQVDKTKEILEITAKIIQRHNIPNITIATEVAISLYENGIYLDKFQEKYYQPPFDLDEIICYFINKKIREEKIIHFEAASSKHKQASSKMLSGISEKSTTKIIKYQLRLKKNHYPSSRRYYEK